MHNDMGAERPTLCGHVEEIIKDKRVWMVKGFNCHLL